MSSKNTSKLSDSSNSTKIKPKRKPNNTLAMWRTAARDEGIVGKLPKKGTKEYDAVKARVEKAKKALN